LIKIGAIVADDGGKLGPGNLETSAYDGEHGFLKTGCRMIKLGVRRPKPRS
jgi:hypothetical protein